MEYEVGAVGWPHMNMCSYMLCVNESQLSDCGSVKDHVQLPAVSVCQNRTVFFDSLNKIHIRKVRQQSLGI